MLELDKENFEAEVLEVPGPVFVDFYSDSCEPCQALMPVIHDLAEKYGDKLKFTKVNTMKARRMAISQKVLGLPVTAIYKNGEKVAELVKEECKEDRIEEMIKGAI